MIWPTTFRTNSKPCVLQLRRKGSHAVLLSRPALPLGMGSRARSIRRSVLSEGSSSGANITRLARAAIGEYNVYKRTAALSTKEIPRALTKEGYLKQAGAMLIAAAAAKPMASDMLVRYDWPKKVSIALTPKEVAKCLLAEHDGKVVVSHGKDEAAKVFSIERVAEGHLLTLCQGSNCVSMELDADEMLVLRTIVAHVLPRLLGF